MVTVNIGKIGAENMSIIEGIIGPVAGLLDRIVPAVSNMPAIRDAKARMREALVANVHHQKAILLENQIVREAIERGQIRVIGAIYEIGSGAVDFLEED